MKAIDLKYLLAIFLLLFTSDEIKAQNESYLSAEKIEERIEVLNGKALFVIRSSHDNLTISTNVVQDKIVKSAKNANGEYEYKITADLLGRNDRLFTINRDVLKSTIKETLKPNICLFYSVEEVEMPITLLEQTSLANHHFVSGEAAIEFITTIEGLQVRCADLLPHKITKEKTDAGTQAITLIFSIQPYMDVQESMEKLSREYDLIDNKYLTEGSSLPVEMLDKMEEQMTELKVEIEKLEKTYALMSRVEIYGDKTNKLSVSIEGMGAKQKKSYSVLLLKEKVEVFETEYAQLLRNGEQAEENRKFSTALGFYEQASSLEDAPMEGWATLEEKIKEMKECADYASKGANAMSYIAKLKKEADQTKIQEVENQFKNARICYENLYKLRGSDPFYKDLIDKIDAQLDKMNFYVIEGSVRQKNGGKRITGVSVYAVPDRVFDKKMEKRPFGIKLDEVDSEGNFRLEIKRDSGYGGLLFVPENNKEFKKNAYVTMPHEHLKTTIYLID